MLLLAGIAAAVFGKKPIERQKKINQCQTRCKSWFSGMPDVERSCKNGCKTNTELTKDEFLCSNNYIEESLLIARYGYDPCPGRGATLESYLDPLGDRSREDVKNEQLSELAVILGIAAGAAVLIFLAIILMKK